MNKEQASFRPLGWWLKEADARLDAAFNSALKDTQVDRRGWQVLASLSHGPIHRADLISTLAAFDSPDVIEGVIDRMSWRGWVEEAADVVRLTPAGVEKQAALAPLVDGVRQQVTAALPLSDYTELVGLLSRLVDALAP